MSEHNQDLVMVTPGLAVVQGQPLLRVVEDRLSLDDAEALGIVTVHRGSHDYSQPHEHCHCEAVIDYP